jgi:glucokinase
MNEPLYIGALDIGGTKIAAMVAGPDGPLARVVAPTAKTGSERAMPEQTLALLEAACREAGVPHEALSAIGVACAGPFVRREGMIAVSTPNISGGLRNDGSLPNDWIEIPLERVLRERYARVRIANDCVAALAGERIFGAAQGEDDCAYVTWSTGIGYGFCVDGHILEGKHGNAGHAGHMMMSEREEAVCGCGNRGDLEGLISGRNIGRPLGLSAPELFDRARAGEPQARAATLEAARWFGRGLYNVTVALDTRVFIIGGSIWNHHGDWLLPMVQEEIAGRLPMLTNGVSIRSAGLDGVVADIGALCMAMPADWIVAWRRSEPWKTLEAMSVSLAS